MDEDEESVKNNKRKGQTGDINEMTKVKELKLDSKKTQIKEISNSTTKMDAPSDNQNRDANLDKEEVNKYIRTDKGPFSVIIDTKTPKNMLSVIIAKIIKGNNMTIKNITEINKKMARVEFESYDKANRCVRKDDPLNKLFEEKGYRCFIPKSYTHVEGVVKGILEEFNLEEVKNNLRSETPITQIEILQTWDRNQKALKNTKILKIEIRASFLPREILFYDIKVKTDIFIPKIKFCSTCLNYGHIRKHCHSKITRCSKYAKPTKQGEPHQCQDNPEFKFCEGEEHYTYSRD